MALVNVRLGSEAGVVFQNSIMAFAGCWGRFLSRGTTAMAVGEGLKRRLSISCQVNLLPRKREQPGGSQKASEARETGWTGSLVCGQT